MQNQTKWLYFVGREVFEFRTVLQTFPLNLVMFQIILAAFLLWWMFLLLFETFPVLWRLWCSVASFLTEQLLCTPPPPRNTGRYSGFLEYRPVFLSCTRSRPVTPLHSHAKLLLINHSMTAGCTEANLCNRLTQAVSVRKAQDKNLTKNLNYGHGFCLTHDKLQI